MFIGNLDEYEKFIISFEKLAQDFDGSLAIDSDNLIIDHDSYYDRNFFNTENSTQQNLLPYELSNITNEITGLGFDLISKSKNSPYGYNGEMEVAATISKNSNSSDDGTHVNFNAQVDSKTLENPEEVQKFEDAHREEKFNEIENKPDQTTIETSDQYIADQEKNLEKMIEEEGTIDGL